MSLPSKRTLHPIGNRRNKERTVLGNTNRSAALLDQTQRIQDKLSSTNPNLHSSLSSVLYHTLPYLARFKNDETINADSFASTSVSLPWRSPVQQDENSRNIRRDDSRFNKLYFRQDVASRERKPSNDLPSGNANTSNLIYMQKKRIKTDRSSSAPIFTGSNIEPFSAALSKQEELSNTIDNTVYPNPIAKTRYGRTYYKKTNDLLSDTQETHFKTTRQFSETMNSTIAFEDLRKSQRLAATRLVKLRNHQNHLNSAIQKHNEKHHEDRGKKIAGYDGHRTAKYFQTSTMVL